jgi:hypothetical protein
VEGIMRRKLDERMEVNNTVENNKRKCCFMTRYDEEESGDAKEDEEMEAMSEEGIVAWCSRYTNCKAMEAYIRGEGKEP